MKFENDYFEVSIEKKVLTEEQKEAHKQKMKKRRPVIILALVLVIAIIGGSVYAHFRAGDGTQTADTVAVNEGGNAENGGADNNGGLESGNETESEGEEFADTLREYGQIEGEYMETSKLASGLQEKYANENLYGYTYAEPIEDVGRAEAITFNLGYNVDDLGVEKWTEIYAMYQDPELKYPMGVKYAFDETTGVLTMEPSDSSVPCEISLRGMDVGTVQKYPHNEYHFFAHGAGTSWGNIGTAYLASYRDKETGELLETPEVCVVTFQAEIDEAPMLSYSITEDGRAHFRWNEVEGATEYFFCIVDKEAERGYNNSMEVISITNGTEWITEYPEYGGYTANSDFRIFDISEDDWKDERYYEDNLEKYEEPDVPNRREWLDAPMEKGLCVIAVNEEGTSMVSNFYDISELSPKLPYGYATNTKKENGFQSSMLTYETVESLPAYDYITMCDGYTATKLIDYDTENAYMQEKRYMIMDEETGEVTGGETLNTLCIPYRVEGTCFMDEVTVTAADEGAYDKADFEKDIAFLEDREEKLSPKSGGLELENMTQYSAHLEVNPTEIRKVDTTVFANSALSEYLAINMLGGVEIIDLSDFPEASDTNLVADALLEAYYQNPLILGIEGYRVSKNGNKVRVVYEETLEGQAQKQEEIKQKVSDVVAQIITDDMTEQDKVVAINQYLCDTIVYDDAALANAEENDFMQVDEEFYDSFNAYGALMNGRCVCAGYSAAFRLLAEEAGLEAIVVTGFLDGTLAHAWNKVKIDDEWYVVDTTNNDNEFFFNALLNLPDSVSDGVLVEDDDYMMDVKIPMYTGDSDENEYYHITDKYFPVQEIAQTLATELAEDGDATLRTDYEINDNEFYEITDAVYDIMGNEVELYGYYWLGVIYLTTEG